MCFIKKNGRKHPRQTKRASINLNEIIFPYIEFKRPEFQAVLEWLSQQEVKELKGVFTQIPQESLGELEKYCDKKAVKGNIATLNTVVDGFKFVFGTGGIHGSIDPATVHSDKDWVICDLDVTSYYPSLAICNTIYPEHLTEKFCEIYADMKQQRTEFSKGAPENAMLKLALNGVYGDSNNKYSPFYDPQYTLSITINGQLLLCMLSESLMEIKGLKMIQANTDGVTVILPRSQLEELRACCLHWELETGLNLEDAYYKRMFIRDVNNYIAEYGNDKLKRKGAYEYDVAWHQNHSSLVIQKAVEANLIYGIDIEEFVTNHDDIFDFYLRTKVPRTSRLVLRTEDKDEQIQNISRYYISTSGGKLIKIMPPLKGKTEEREIGINKSYCIAIPSDSHDKFPDDLNYDFYIQEANKMVKPLINQFTPDA